MKTKGFTLIELMVVILIVGILAAASIPLMRGRIESAKWSEANAMAGTVRSAARVYFAENGSIATTTTMKQLGFDSGDLDGTYFSEACFKITKVAEDNSGNVEVTVDADSSAKTKKPSGKYVLETDGDWVKQ